MRVPASRRAGLVAYMAGRYIRIRDTNLRAEIEPVSLADYQRFLLDWHGLTEAERREGPDALGVVLGELAGAVLPASVWEREVLPARVRDYSPSMLDEQSACGAFVWWRPAPSASSGPRPTTIAASPIRIVPRATLGAWRRLAERRRSGPLAKVGGFTALIALAALNKWRFGPRIAAGAAAAFRRGVAVEWVLIAAVLTVTATMTTLFSPD
jgi:hypothetical protein